MTILCDGHLNQKYSMHRRTASPWTRIGQLALIEIGITLAATPSRPAFAGSYSFVNIADTVAGFTNFHAASVNNSGRVAFQATRSGIPGVYVGSGGPITTTADTTGEFSDMGSSASINDSGVVAFRASLDTGGVGIFIGNGGSTTGDVSSIGPFAYFDPPASNSNGQIAFSATLDDGGAGIWVTSGITLTPIASLGGTQNFTSFYPPAINNAGTLAFAAYRHSGPLSFLGIYTASDGALTPIFSGPAAIIYSGLSINDGGSVAYAETNVNADSFIVVNSGGTNIVVATAPSDGTGPFAGVDSPAINKLGTVAFRAGVDAVAGPGIFTGPDPVADKVILKGDALFGSTVTYIESFGNGQLNDRGDVAFKYTLASGVEGIAVARTGDYNANGIVDAADYVVWRKGLGTLYTPADYDAWRAHYGQAAGSGASLTSNATGSVSAVVPEPASIILLALALPACRLIAGRRQVGRKVRCNSLWRAGNVPTVPALWPRSPARANRRHEPPGPVGFLGWHQRENHHEL